MLSSKLILTAFLFSTASIAQLPSLKISNPKVATSPSSCTNKNAENATKLSLPPFIDVSNSEPNAASKPGSQPLRFNTSIYDRLHVKKVDKFSDVGISGRDHIVPCYQTRPFPCCPGHQDEGHRHSPFLMTPRSSKISYFDSKASAQNTP
ncbi:hypothetical protein EYR41_005610 [Orbilia oligospora]|uniref:Uncharacterized protein n=1 Tax=Orbilia oligospora TaxID=2813651 RepID=A0A7C8PFG2_ORBOL|nr:hypothetical protein TWF751_009657 [Orbilia oligospora]TGJ69581.1 hypothetical protein EYR41_005610 [Orbilia oligospora]